MMTSTKLLAAAALVIGAAAFAPRPAAALPVAPVALDAGAIDQAHAVRRCDRWGRCWWTTAGHYHGRYGWRGGRYYGHRYGWRGGRHYGYGWHGHRHWR